MYEKSESTLKWDSTSKIHHLSFRNILRRNRMPNQVTEFLKISYYYAICLTKVACFSESWNLTFWEERELNSWRSLNRGPVCFFSNSTDLSWTCGAWGTDESASPSAVFPVGNGVGGHPSFPLVEFGNVWNVVEVVKGWTLLTQLVSHVMHISLFLYFFLHLPICLYL